MTTEHFVLQGARSSTIADLSSDRRSEVEAANKAFASSVEGITRQVVSLLSAADAKAALVAGLQQLGTRRRSRYIDAALALALLALTSTLVAARYVTRGGPF